MVVALTVGDAIKPRDFGRRAADLECILVSGTGNATTTVKAAVTGHQIVITRGWIFADGAGQAAETLTISSNGTTRTVIHLPIPGEGGMYPIPIPRGILTASGEALKFTKSSYTINVYIWLDIMLAEERCPASMPR